MSDEHQDAKPGFEGWQGVPRAELETFGDTGDLTRQFLLTPAILELLGDVAGLRVLDAGCGQGYLARILARRGARVLGVEPAEPLVSYAREREAAEPLGVAYEQADLTTWRWPGPPFDAAVASRVLMDIADDEAALAACLAALRPGGHLVIAISHPCFEESDGAFAANGQIATREYFARYVIPQGWGARVHRPLGHYLNALIAQGARIAGVREPQAPPDPSADALERSRHVPSVLVVLAEKC
jgi:SAM-dependent methyltransferase